MELSLNISPEKDSIKNFSDIIEMDSNVNPNLMLSKIDSEDATENILHDKDTQLLQGTSFDTVQLENPVAINENSKESVQKSVNNDSIKEKVDSVQNEDNGNLVSNDIIEERVQESVGESVQKSVSNDIFENYAQLISNDIVEESAKQSVQKSANNDLIKETHESVQQEDSIKSDSKKTPEAVDFNQDNIDNEDFLFNKICSNKCSFKSESYLSKSKPNEANKIEMFEDKNDSILAEVDNNYQQNSQIDDVINNLDMQSEKSENLDKFYNEIQKPASVENNSIQTEQLSLNQENIIDTQKSIENHSMDQEIIQEQNLNSERNSNQMLEEDCFEQKSQESNSESTKNQNESVSKQEEARKEDATGVLKVNEKILKSRNITPVKTPTKLDDIKSNMKQSLTKENSVMRLNGGSRNPSIMQSCSKVRDENNNPCNNYDLPLEDIEKANSAIGNELSQSEKNESKEHKASIDKELFDKNTPSHEEVIEPVIEYTLFEEDSEMNESILKNIFDQHSHSHPFFNDQIVKETSDIEQDISVQDMNDNSLGANDETRSVDNNFFCNNVDKNLLQEFELENILNKNTSLSDSEKVLRKRRYLQIYYPESYKEILKNDELISDKNGNKVGFQAPIYPLGHPCEFSGV